MSRTVCGDGLKITARRVRTGLENSDDSRSRCTASSVEERCWAGPLFAMLVVERWATGSALNVAAKNEFELNARVQSNAKTYG